jgi:hypothetical protein
MTMQINAIHLTKNRRKSEKRSICRVASDLAGNCDVVEGNTLKRKLLFNEGDNYDTGGDKKYQR